jgi:hypothetical protein
MSDSECNICFEVRPLMTLPCLTCSKSVCFQCDTNMWVNDSIRCPYCRADAPTWGHILLNATPLQLEAYLHQHHTLEQITLGQLSSVLHEMETTMELDDMYDWFDEIFENDNTTLFQTLVLRKLKLYATQRNKVAYERLRVIFDFFLTYTELECYDDILFDTVIEPVRVAQYTQHVFPVGAREYTR